MLQWHIIAHHHSLGGGNLQDTRILTWGWRSKLAGFNSKVQRVLVVSSYERLTARWHTSATTASFLFSSSLLLDNPRSQYAFLFQRAFINHSANKLLGGIGNAVVAQVLRKTPCWRHHSVVRQRHAYYFHGLQTAWSFSLDKSFVEFVNETRTQARVTPINKHNTTHQLQSYIWESRQMKTDSCLS